MSDKKQENQEISEEAAFELYTKDQDGLSKLFEQADSAKERALLGSIIPTNPARSLESALGLLKEPSQVGTSRLGMFGPGVGGTDKKPVEDKQQIQRPKGPSSK